MTIGERIRSVRERKKMTQEELGSHCGTTKQTIFKYENGVVTNIPLDRLDKIASALGVSTAYLMGWEPEIPNKNEIKNILPLPKMVKRPRLGTIACGRPILAVEEADQYDLVPEDIQCDFTLRCRGDSMINARIYDGDIVYIRAQDEVENGEIAAVRVADEATLKRVYYNGQRVILRACNPLYPDLEFEGEELDTVQVLGKAIAFTSMVQNNL